MGTSQEEKAFLTSQFGFESSSGMFEDWRGPWIVIRTQGRRGSGRGLQARSPSRGRIQFTTTGTRTSLITAAVARIARIFLEDTGEISGTTPSAAHSCHTSASARSKRHERLQNAMHPLPREFIV